MLCVHRVFLYMLCVHTAFSALSDDSQIMEGINMAQIKEGHIKA